jgi:hypothetical protein
MEQLYEALGEIGYSLHTPTTRFDAAAPLQLLEQLSRMVIIGEPASGKSLLLHRLKPFRMGIENWKTCLRTSTVWHLTQKDLCSAIRDEDDRYKHRLFSQIWPAVKNLHGSGLLYKGAIARELFETLDKLSLYLPESQKSELETILDQWRAEDEWPDDHPLRTDPALNRILSTAKTRRHL